MTPRFCLLLLLAAVLGSSLQETASAQLIIPGSKRPIPGSYVPRQRPIASSGCIGVLGAIEHPGVYKMPGERVALGDLLRWGGNLTQSGTGEIRLLRSWAIHRLDLSAQSLGATLLAGDVVIFEAAAAAATQDGTDALVRTQSFEPGTGTATATSEPDVQLAFVGLFDRPVIARVRAEDATIANLVTQLRQPPEIASTVRVVAPGSASLETSPAGGLRLVSGSVLLFEPSVLRHDLLPPPPPVLEPEGADHPIAAPQPHEYGVAGSVVENTFNAASTTSQATAPRIQATFVAPVERRDAHTSSDSASLGVVAPEKGMESLVGSEGQVLGAAGSQVSGTSQRMIDRELRELELRDIASSTETAVDVNNSQATAEQTPAKDYAIHLGPAFEERHLRSSHDSKRGDSLLKGSGVVPWVIGALAGGTLLYLGVLVAGRLWSRLHPANAESTENETPAGSVPLGAVRKKSLQLEEKTANADNDLTLIGRLLISVGESFRFVRKACSAGWSKAHLLFLRRADDADGDAEASPPKPSPRAEGKKPSGNRTPKITEAKLPELNLTGVRINRRVGFEPLSEQLELRAVSSSVSETTKMKPAPAASRNSVEKQASTSVQKPVSTPKADVLIEQPRSEAIDRRARGNAPSAVPSRETAGTLGRALAQLQARTIPQP